MLTAHCPSQDSLNRADQIDGAKPCGIPWRVVAVAGFDPAADIRETLRGVGAHHETLIRHQPRAEPPCGDELLRVEELDGSPLSGSRIAERWHRPPYALPLRLARYAPLSTEADVLDFAVIGTQGERREFIERVERTAARLVQDAIAGSSRGATGLSARPRSRLRRSSGPARAAPSHGCSRTRVRPISPTRFHGLAPTGCCARRCRSRAGTAGSSH